MGKCEICGKKTDYTVLENGACNYCSKSSNHSHYICKKCSINSETASNKNNPNKSDVKSKSNTKNKLSKSCWTE